MATRMKKREKNKRQRTPFFGIPLIMPYLRPYVKTVLLMIFLGILSSLADTIFPLFNSWALDHFVAERTLEGMPVFLFLYILLMVLQELDNYYCLYQCGKVEVEIDRDLRNAVFAHLQTLSFSYFNQNSVGYIHARTMSDTERIGELMAWRMMDVVWNVSYIICVTVMMLVINARLALYVLIMVPAAVLIILYFQKKIVAGSRQVREIMEIELAWAQASLIQLPDTWRREPSLDREKAISYGEVSFETGLESELLTYGEETLRLYRRMVDDCKAADINLIVRVFDNKAKRRGFMSAQALEAHIRRSYATPC